MQHFNVPLAWLHKKVPLPLIVHNAAGFNRKRAIEGADRLGRTNEARWSGATRLVGPEFATQRSNFAHG
jgi:hypothetical protein